MLLAATINFPTTLLSSLSSNPIPTQLPSCVCPVYTCFARPFACPSFHLLLVHETEPKFCNSRVSAERRLPACHSIACVYKSSMYISINQRISAFVVGPRYKEIGRTPQPACQVSSAERNIWSKGMQKLKTCVGSLLWPRRRPTPRRCCCCYHYKKEGARLTAQLSIH